MMSKRLLPLTQLEIVLDQHDSTPLYRQLYERLRAQILAGQLQAGTRLPSTRALAGALGISRNTVALAFEQLQLEGYVESRVGDGTRVARLQPQQLYRGTTHAAAPVPPALIGPHTARLSQRSQLIVDTLPPGELNADPGNRGLNVFRAGQPDVSHFPYDAWARLLARHARRSLQGVARYQHPQGYAPLREAVAAHIGITRGVHCSPEQIILTAGAQGALDLVARVLLDSGESAWVEDPGYFGARGALLAAGARLVPVPVDQEGLDIEAGLRLCRGARLAVATPSHQFPIGVTMSLSRRLALLEWAREEQAWIVEDDYDSEYRFGGRPLEAMYGLDGGRRVLYVGTFSKALFPSLRLGYLVAPRQLLEALIAMRHLIDVHPALLEQLALADFIFEGQLARYVRKMRLLYLERRDALVAALTQELGDTLDIVVPEAGLHLAAWLPSGLSAQMVVQRAEARGLRLLPLSRFSLRPLQRDGLVFGFATAAPDELRAGVKTLALAVRTL